MGQPQVTTASMSRNLLAVLPEHFQYALVEFRKSRQGMLGVQFTLGHDAVAIRPAPVDEGAASS